MLRVLFLFLFAANVMAGPVDLEVTALKSDVTTSMGEQDLLKYNAFKQAIANELDAKKLDSKLFFEKLDLKKMIAKEEYEYLKNFFMEIELALPATIEKKEIPSESDKLTGFFKANLDSNKLEVTYNELTSVLSDSAKNTFYIIADIDLDDKLSWEEVGVSKKENFASVIIDSWKKLINTQYPAFENIVELERDFASKPDFMNEKSVTLKWKSTIKKTADHPETKTASFEVSAQYVLLKTKNGDVLTSFDFPVQKKEVDVANKKNTSSVLASTIYNLFLSQREKIKSYVEAPAAAAATYIDLKIVSKTGLSDILGINNFLQDRYKEIALVSSIKSYSTEGTVLRIQANVPVEKILEQLATLDGKVPMNEKKILLFDRTAKTFAILPKDSNN